MGASNKTLPEEYTLDVIFEALRKSNFRSRFYLYPKEHTHLQDKGLPLVLEHASDFIARRLAPASPLKDGKQTPWRGHPVFIAQHATGTCCRGCLAKWHGLSKARALTDEEQQYVMQVIGRWLKGQLIDDERTEDS
jgi:predicted Fe-S protein YdhL (DUF1289 family)